MAEKVLNTRIVIKNDTLEAFNKSTFIPKKGELLLAQVDVWQIDSVTQEKVLVPTYLMKVGDGIHVFSQLNWVAAQAADVHDWAKAKTKPSYTAGEITGLSDYISGKVQDTNTTYRLVQDENDKHILHWYSKELNGTETEVATITIPDNDTQEFTITANAEDDDVIILEGTNGENSVTYKASHAKKGPTGGATKGALADVNISGYNSSGSIKVPKAIVDEYGHVTGLTEQTLSITMPAEQDLTDYAKKTDTVANATTADKLKNKLVIGTKEFNGSEEVEITAADLGLSGAMHFIGAVDTLPSSSNDGDVVLVGGKEYVWSNNKWNELGDEGSHALKTVTITGTDGLTGGGAIDQNREIKHAVPANATEGDHKSDKARTYLTNVKTDKFGHIVGFEVGTENDQDLSNYKTKQEAVSAEGSTVKTVTKVEQNDNGEISITYGDIAFPAPPEVNNGKFTVSGTGALTGSGQMTANQAGETSAILDVANKGITTSKIADGAIGMSQTKASSDYTGEDAEVWVFNCGTSTVNV